MLSRRRFVRLGACVGAGMLIPEWLVGCAQRGTTQTGSSAAKPLDPTKLNKWADAMPIPGVMQPQKANYYEIGAYQLEQRLHSELGVSTVWGYGTSRETAGYPGRTIEAVRGTPIQVRWTNNLDDVVHPLPVDPTLHWADPNGMMAEGMRGMDVPKFPPGFPKAQSPVALVTHLHGGEQEPASDGGPVAWYTPGFSKKGASFVKDLLTYHNGQQAATLWYHDHALGITRLNVYMGLAGFYLLRDPGLESKLGLPGPAPALGEAEGTKHYEIPIVIQDRMFTEDGRLYFPVAPTNPSVHPYWGPEFFGDTMLVNGKVWPHLQVEPRRYRLRLLNGCNARFLNLDFGKDVTVVQIGTDGGYLAEPVQLKTVFIAPGERADVVADFSKAAGQSLVVSNDANTPFPDGVAVNKDTTAQVLQFRVGGDAAQDGSTVPVVLNTIPKLSPTPDMPHRVLALNEIATNNGPLEILVNNTGFDVDASETPKLGTTEVWEIVNLTMDTHPIHLHLVQFQLLDRQAFNSDNYAKTWAGLFPGGQGPKEASGPPLPYGQVVARKDGTQAVGGNPDYTSFLTGQRKPPLPEERGWKDTVKANKGEITRFVVRFAPNTNGEKVTEDFPFDATAQPGYVWHCHIIDHEDNEMMRPYTVKR
jgi:spore coat protein A